MPYVWPGVTSGTTALAAVINGLGEEVEALSSLVRVASGVLVTRLASQSIPNAVGTPIQFSAEEFDSDGMFTIGTSNTTLTLAQAGLWVAFGFGSWAANATGNRLTDITVNGSTLVREARPGFTGNSNSTTVGTAFVGAVGNTVQLVVTQSSGGALNFTDARFFLARLAIT